MGFVIDPTKQVYGEWVFGYLDGYQAWMLKGIAPPTNFTVGLDFTANETLDPRITASGGANGTRINSAGTIVAKTTPRYDYDAVTLKSKGLLIEEARTNLFTSAAVGGAGLITQGVTVTAAPTTISFYGTGTMTLSGAYSATIVGQGAYPKRTVLTFTPTAGALLCTVTGSCQWAQCETGPFATSFIPSAGAPTTRTPDVMVMTGTNFTGWFNAATGTFVALADVLSSLGNAQVVFEADAGDFNNRIFSYLAPGTLSAQVVTANVAQAAYSIAVPAIIPFNHAIAYAANDVAVSVNGGATQVDNTVTLPAGLTTMRLGAYAGSLYLNGHLQSLKYFPRRCTNAEVQALSQ